MNAEHTIPLFSGTPSAIPAITKVDLDTDSILASREIPWEIYSTARLITDRDLQLLRRYDHRGQYGASWAANQTGTSTSARIGDTSKSTSDAMGGAAARWGMLCGEEGHAYVEAMLSVLKSVTKDETVQYVLAMLDDITVNMVNMVSVEGLGSGREGRMDMMRRLLFAGGDRGASARVDPYEVLTKLLARDDWYTKEKAATLLSVALACDPGGDMRGALEDEVSLLDVDVGGVVSTMPASTTGSTRGSTRGGCVAQAQLIDWCVHQLKKPSHPQCAVPTALHCLSVVLKEVGGRRVVYSSGGVQAVVGVLTGRAGAGGEQSSSSLSVQAQYDVALCVWLLSLFPPALEILAVPAVMKALVDFVRLAHKEKVIRVALLALTSLLREKSGALGSSGSHVTVSLELTAVESGLPKAIEHRKNQEWDDPDMVMLLDNLQERLDAGVLAMSSMERYKKEVAEGVLVPGPMHDSEAFWLENAERFMDNNSAVLKGLLGLLDPSHDATTLRLACRGVSNFVQYFPHGKGVVSDLEGKTLVMRLMAHPDSGVQRDALLCIQRLLLSKGNVSYLSRTVL